MKYCPLINVVLTHLVGVAADFDTFEFIQQMLEKVEHDVLEDLRADGGYRVRTIIFVAVSVDAEREERAARGRLGEHVRSKY